MFVNECEFGKTKSGELVKKITIGNGKNLEFSVLNRGATLQSFKISDKSGILEECILGFDNVKEYEDHLAYYGATVGRVANRIAGGNFELSGTTFNIVKNDGNVNSLHGGTIGFDKVIWSYSTFNNESKAGITFNYLSIDGEENFPGNLDVSITFSLTDKDEFIMEYTAKTDKETPINLTNHAYWNLSGFKENIHNHILQINAESYLPINENRIPTGEFKSVEGSAFDFRKPTQLGSALNIAGGFDHNFNLTDKKQVSTVNTMFLEDPKSGRSMEVKTTEPGVQIYTGFEKHEAICLETQMYPDAINQNKFDSVILKPGDIYKQKTIHTFKINK